MRWVVKIRSHGVEITQDRPKQAWSWVYPDGLVASGEVKDSAGLARAFGEYALSLRKKPPKLTVVLDDEIVFYKNLANTDELKAFLEKVPLETERMMKKIVTYKDGKMDVWVTNQDLVRPILKAIEESGGRVGRIVTESGKSGDFLVSEKSQGGTTSGIWLKLVWVIGIFVWVGIIAALVWKFGKR